MSSKIKRDTRRRTRQETLDWLWSIYNDWEANGMVCTGPNGEVLLDEDGEFRRRPVTKGDIAAIDKLIVRLSKLAVPGAGEEPEMRFRGQQIPQTATIPQTAIQAGLPPLDHEGPDAAVRSA